MVDRAEQHAPRRRRGLACPGRGVLTTARASRVSLRLAGRCGTPGGMYIKSPARMTPCRRARSGTFAPPAAPRPVVSRETGRCGDECAEYLGRLGPAVAGFQTLIGH